jgi:RHS repeat-associated protein
VIGLTDGAGTLVVSYRYDPWGNLLATGGSNPNLTNPFRFTGREYDAESGLYYFRARYYDPLLGRFISGDPVPLELSGNGYAYAFNNPTNLGDSLGTLPFSDNVWVQLAIRMVKEGQSTRSFNWLRVYSTALGSVPADQRAAVLEYIEAQTRGTRLTQAATQAWNAIRPTFDPAYGPRPTMPGTRPFIPLGGRGPGVAFPSFSSFRPPPSLGVRVLGAVGVVGQLAMAGYTGWQIGRWLGTRCAGGQTVDEWVTRGFTVLIEGWDATWRGRSRR